MLHERKDRADRIFARVVYLGFGAVELALIIGAYFVLR